MKVILLERVPNIGNLGDVATVRGGYARNWLFPQGKAERATPRAVAEFDSRRADLEKRQNMRHETLREAAEALEGYLLQIPARASADGGLYGSITPAVIAKMLNAQKLAPVDIRRGQIFLSGGNLKETGDHEVEIVLDDSLRAKITVSVLAEDGAAESAARKGGGQ
ncbi:MAG: 50S ribosomal protein L9 [Gammaproteobacteria bacterium]